MTIFPTMTKKTKKKRFDPLFRFLRHPLFPFPHLKFVRCMIAWIGLLAMAAGVCAFEPATTPQKAGASHAHDFVIFVTVFNNQGFALYGARTRLRREEEKKFRWEAASDHQGELAFRVPEGQQYEMVVEARGFQTQTRKIDAREENQVDLTIRMEPQTKGGAGGKP